MANTQEFDSLHDYLSAPRFDANKLVGATIATLTSLKTDSAAGLKILPKAEALWQQLTGKQSLNTAEYEIIDNQIRSLREGTSSVGQSYEAMCYSKGTQVVYSAASITLIPKSGHEVVIPNHPVPPPPKVTPRLYQEWLSPWVTGNFDIAAGQVEFNVQAREKDPVWTGRYSRINISGLDALKVLVRRVLMTSPQWADLSTNNKSCQGWQFMDMWTTACATAPFDYYLALHNVIITKCLTQARFAPSEATKHMRADQQKMVLKISKAPMPAGEPVDPYPPGTIVPLHRKDVREDEAEAVARFIKTTGHAPYMLAGPVKTVINFFLPETADEQIALTAYHRTQKLFGGKKRGLGRIAASFNFGPRMEKVWREINFLCNAVDTLDQAADVRVSSGAFGPMLVFCRQRKDPDVKLLLADTQSILVAGLSDAERVYVTMDRRINVVYIGVEEKPVVPDLDPKKPSLAIEKIETAYQIWRRTLPRGAFFIHTKAFAKKTFTDYKVLSAGEPFDLSAIVTNIEPQDYIPYTSKEFYIAAVKSMRKMITWWHAPERTFTPLAGYFQPDPKSIHWSEENGFTMVPDFEYGGEDVLEEASESSNDEWDDLASYESEGDEQDDEHQSVPEVVRTTLSPQPPPAVAASLPASAAASTPDPAAAIPDPNSSMGQGGDPPPPRVIRREESEATRQRRPESGRGKGLRNQRSRPQTVQKKTEEECLSTEVEEGTGWGEQ